MFGAKTKIKINLVAFLILAILLIYAMATQVLSVLESRYTVNAIFPDAGGVFTNQEVTYRGITVGQVGSLEVVDAGVEIELMITQGVVIPKEGIEARVMFKSAVGEQFVDLLPGSDEGPYLEDGDVIPLSQTSIPVSTQELLSTLEAVLRGVPPEALKGAVDALGIGLTDRGSDLATILQSVADLAGLFAERSPEIEDILEQGITVGEGYLANAEDFKAAINDLVTVSDTLSDSTPDLERLLRGGADLSDELVAFIRENRPELHEVLIELGQINDLQAEHADDLTRILKHLPTALQRVIFAFEADTGMVRFGLVQDNANPGCNYGTARRAPSERGDRLPPKAASCKKADSATSSSFSDSSLSIPGAVRLAGTANGDIPLPSRMAEWSWSLFYLNGL